MNLEHVPLALLGGNAGGGELLVVFVVALLLFGSRSLPRIARSLGHAVEEFRRAAHKIGDEISSGDEPPPPSSHEPGIAEKKNSDEDND